MDASVGGFMLQASLPWNQGPGALSPLPGRRRQWLVGSVAPNDLDVAPCFRKVHPGGCQGPSAAIALAPDTSFLATRRPAMVARPVGANLDETSPTRGARRV